MNKLHHPNLVQLLHTTRTQEGQPGMVLEYMRGGALDEWLVERGVDVSQEDLLNIAHQVGAAACACVMVV